jgi:hypothetical protein
VGHVVRSSACRPQNVNTLFFMLRWAWYGFYKKRSGRHCTELVFSHSVQSAGHVVHSGASGA